MLNNYSSILLAAVLAGSPAIASTHHQLPQSAIARQIEADVAEIVHGINTRNINEATKFDAPSLISMESMRTPSYGAKADHDGLSDVFKYEPSWHLSMIDEAVDVARSGEMAIYRSTYRENSTREGTPYTHKVNYIAGFQRDADGMWRIHWSVVCAQSPSQKQ